MKMLLSLAWNLNMILMDTKVSGSCVKRENLTTETTGVKHITQTCFINYLSSLIQAKLQRR